MNIYIHMVVTVFEAFKRSQILKGVAPHRSAEATKALSELNISKQL